MTDCPLAAAAGNGHRPKVIDPDGQVQASATFL